MDSIQIYGVLGFWVWIFSVPTLINLMENLLVSEIFKQIFLKRTAKHRTSSEKFSIVNMWEQYLFAYSAFLTLAKTVRTIDVVFDQCTFGLTFPGCKPTEFCKKRSRILTTLQTLKALEQNCAGVSETHSHVHAWGSLEKHICPELKIRKKATLAGVYPAALCETWAQAVKDGLSLRPRSAASSPSSIM